MSTLKVAGNPAGGGDVTIQGPASAVTRTLTLPDVTGTLAAQETVIGGAGQTWQDVTVSRALGATYTNSTGRAIFITLSIIGSAAGNVDVSISGVPAGVITMAAGGLRNTMHFIVPAGATYTAASSGPTLTRWSELR